MNATAAVAPSETHREMILRVFGGRLDGAEFRLPPDRLLTLGHMLDNDIVLRGADTKGCRLELQEDKERLRVRLVTGEAQLLGQPLEPDRDVVLPCFVPLALGEYRFAIGEEGHERWVEAQELAQQLALSEPLQAADPAERLPRAEQAKQRAQSLLQYAPGWLAHPATPIIAALVLAFLVALGPIRDFATQDLDGPDQARAALAANGLSGVKVARDPSGEFLVFSGTVSSDQQLVNLRTMVAEDFPQARLDVDTSAALSRSVTDILAAEGIDAEARFSERGVVTVTSEYLPVDRQRELEDRLKADLPGLRRADFELTGDRGASDLAYFFNSGRYGLATYVDGAPGYLVTADGSYWFEGAILPTGHEVLSVMAGRVTVRRNGLVEQLIIDPGARAGTVSDAQAPDVSNPQPSQTQPSQEQLSQGEAP